MGENKVYSVKFTLFLNFIVAGNQEEAIKKAKDYFIDNDIDFDKYKIEINSVER